MAGKKQFDVDLAVDRAMRVFWQHGYADASLDLLAAATGLGRGSLYGAFGGKDALFGRCLDRYSSIYSARYDEAIASHVDDPVAAVEALFEVALGRIADPAVPGGCLVAQSAAQGPTLTEQSRAQVQALLGAQRDRVRAALFPAGLPSGELEELTIFVVAVIQSLAVLSRAGTTDAELRSVTRAARTAVAARIVGRG
jgi:AcrR family transcriptional regulator